MTEKEVEDMIHKYGRWDYYQGYQALVISKYELWRLIEEMSKKTQENVEKATK